MVNNPVRLTLAAPDVIIYPLQIRKWNVKEQDGYSFPRFCETDAISFFINDRKKFRTLSFEPSPNLQFVTQDDLIKIRDYVDGMIRLPDLLSENVLMKRYQIACPLIKNQSCGLKLAF